MKRTCGVCSWKALELSYWVGCSLMQLKPAYKVTRTIAEATWWWRFIKYKPQNFSKFLHKKHLIFSPWGDINTRVILKCIIQLQYIHNVELSHLVSSKTFLLPLLRTRPVSVKQPLPFPQCLSCPALVTTNLFLDLPVLNISYTWNGNMCTSVSGFYNSACFWGSSVFVAFISAFLNNPLYG